MYYVVGMSDLGASPVVGTECSRCAEHLGVIERVQAVIDKVRQVPHSNDPYHVATDIAEALEAAIEGVVTPQPPT